MTSTPVESNQVQESKATPTEETQQNETTPNEASEANTKQLSPNKKGLTSAAWDHFKRENIDGKWKAICKYCEKKLGGETRQGTKHLYDHISSCKLRTVRGPRQSIIRTLQQSSSIGGRTESMVLGTHTFDQDRSRKQLAKMVVVHEYPLSIVEHQEFRVFCNELQPLFKVVSRNTLKSDIMKMYEFEKAKTIKLLDKNASRIAITTDMWTSSNQNKGYMSITSHFIDDNWNLQSRLMRFVYVPAPHSADVLANALVDCLFDWNLDRKLSTLTVDNCSTNDAMIARVLDKISPASFIMQGNLFHMRCCAHILNLIVRDGLHTIYSTIERIRESVVYWVATPKREEKFVETCRQLNIAYSKKLALDCRTRWNSTYLMLVSSIPYQEVFKRLKQRESQYNSLPSDDDWNMAIELVEKLEIFYSVTELFSGTQYPTSNVYFPKVCEIRIALMEWLLSPDENIVVMTDSMISKFDKYWDTINGVMAIGAVLDPRYKFKLLNYFFPLIYGNESQNELHKVKKMCEDLLLEYQAKDKRSVPHASSDHSSSSSLTDVSSAPKRVRWSSNYLQYVHETSSESDLKSELDCYLEESVLVDESNVEVFDILGYWKNVGVKYPTLQKIARDFLAIPISTVASESAFSVGGRILSPHRSRLNEDTVEALMCSQNWFRAGSSRGNTQYFLVSDDIDVDTNANDEGN